MVLSKVHIFLTFGFALGCRQVLSSKTSFNLLNFLGFSKFVLLEDDRDALASSPLLRNAAALLLSSGFLLSPIKFTPGTCYQSSAHSIVAPLADVGIREFLVKDGKQFLRLSLPEGPGLKFGPKSTEDEVYVAQESLELVRLRLEQVGFSNSAVWSPALQDANAAEKIVKKNRVRLISGAKSESDATLLIDNQILPTIQNLESALRSRDIEGTNLMQEKAAAGLAEIRRLQLPPAKLPYEIPEEYSSLPRLAGRATVEMTVLSGGKGFLLEEGKPLVPRMTLKVEVDGYHAPLTAGNFVDLVNKKFYNGLSFVKAEELIVQTGKPSSGSNEGYVNPETKEIRSIPLELFYKKDAIPVYGITSDDDKRSKDSLALPFQAYGAVGMARSNEDPDTASSQFFFLKWNQALVPPGRNTLDGFYSCFGYVVENEKLLSQITLNDRILDAKVTQGLSNLILP